MNTEKQIELDAYAKRVNEHSDILVGRLLVFLYKIGPPVAFVMFYENSFAIWVFNYFTMFYMVGLMPLIHMRQKSHLRQAIVNFFIWPYGWLLEMVDIIRFIFQPIKK